MDCETYDKICKQCGKQFEAQHGSQRYCSEECKKEAKRRYNIEYYKAYDRKHPVKSSEPVIAKCKLCGKEFKKNSKAKKYCSTECARKSHLKQMSDNNRLLRMLGSNPGVGSSDFAEHCIICGNEIDPSSRKKLYCSFECAREAQRRRTESAHKKMKEQKIRERAEARRRASLPSDLDVVLKRMNEYNKKHGTHLTYGQYVLKVEGV